MKEPLHVIVVWDDACTRSTVSSAWDGTIETASRVKEVAPLYRGRETNGLLHYVDEEAIYLAHDRDRDGDTSECGNFTTIPLGWVTKIKSGKRVLYVRS